MPVENFPLKEKIYPLKQKILSWSLFQDPLKIVSVAHTIAQHMHLRGVEKDTESLKEEMILKLPQEGIFMTGIESSDPWTDDIRRNQLKEAHNFYENFSERLQKISDLGIRWLRFGPPYSQTHLSKHEYDFSFMDKVVKECEDLNITIIADLLHFGLPDWMHEEDAGQPFFQNKAFPEMFAEYAEVFVKRYPRISYFTIVNEPFVTATFSAKLGIWNEKRATPWHDDRPFVLATANIARAVILARKKIEQVWKEEGRPEKPIFVHNESFEKALAEKGSGREEEAEIFNIRRFAAMDLIVGNFDPAMRTYLLNQGMTLEEYCWFMEQGSKIQVILGIDHYPWCIHSYTADASIDHDVRQPYQLYELTKEYYARYKLPLLHTEINAWPEFAGSMCLLTYDVLSRLRKEGFPILGMTWYGDEYQVGWHEGLSGPRSFEETPVGLHYKGETQPVAEIFRNMALHGFAPMPRAQQNHKFTFAKLFRKYLNFVGKE